MNSWRVFLKVWGGICVAVALIILYYSYIAFYNDFASFGLGNVVGGVLVALGLYIVAHGFWLEKKYSLYVWLLTIPLSFPLAFVLLYGVFDGGPPLDAPPNWVLFLEATSPVPLSIITSILLWLAYKKISPKDAAQP